MSTPRSLCVSLLLIVSSSILFADTCTKHTHEVKLNTTGETIEGPACVQTTVNALRYSTRIMRTVSETAGQNLPAQLLPPAPITVSDKADTPKNAARSNMDALSTQSCKTINDAFNCVATAVLATEVVLFSQQKQVRDTKAAAAQEINVLKDIVSNSDQILAGGAQSVITSAQSAIHDFQSLTWPDVETTISSLNLLRERLDALQLMQGWSDWYKDHKQQYDDTSMHLNALLAVAQAIAPGQDVYIAVSQQIAEIQHWINLIKALTTDMFAISEDVPCGGLFNLSRTNTLKVTQADNLPTLDLKPATVTMTDNWVVVRCSNPFTVSAGTVFSFLSDSEFGIVNSKITPVPSSGPTTVNQFQVTSTSDVPILPIAIIHGRIWDISKTKQILALHASFGVAAHTRSSAQGGSNPEYLLGGSLSVLRTFFITGGPYWGTQVKLAGGFSPNDTVPIGVTAPPLRKDGTRGWAMAVTFTKP